MSWPAKRPKDRQAPPPGLEAGQKLPFHRRRGRSANEPIYGALDLGTNNCRLLIARPVRGGFRVIDAFSKIVRLGEGVAASRQLSEEAMKRAEEALQACAEKIEKRQVTLMRSVATQACRSAENCGAFVDRVRDRTGIALDIITAEEEARLAVLGCQTLLDRTVPDALVFDIGGGSTELIWVGVARDGEIKIKAWTSLNYGVVNMAERFGFGRISDSQFELMAGTVKQALLDFEAQHGLAARAENGLQLLGTSGTVTTLASLQLGLVSYDRNKVDGALIGCRDVRDLSRRLAGMGNEERATFGCIGHERADLVVSGCAILDAILDMWRVDKLRVADRGIREGVLRSLMRQDGRNV